MKIIMINKTDSLGGAAQVMANLTAGLQNKGHEVRWLVRRKLTDCKHVYELPDPLITGFLRKIINRDIPIVFSHWFNDLGYSTEILTHPMVKWADVIHCHNLHGNYFKLNNLIELSQKKPLIWTWHDWWPVTGHCATPQVCKYKCDTLQNNIWLKKRDIYNQSNLEIVVPSLDMQKNIHIPNIHLNLIHNGVVQSDLSKFSKTQLRKLLNLPQDKKIIMYMSYSRHNIDKGWNFTNQLQKTLPEYYWLEIGYKGVLSQLDLQKYMKASDVFLFPSLAESFGMTPVEAMCQGTPVVGFPVGVIPELIQHKVNGYIAKYKNISDLKAGLKYVLTHQMKKISFNEYSIDTMVKKYHKIYEKLNA